MEAQKSRRSKESPVELHQEPQQTKESNAAAAQRLLDTSLLPFQINTFGLAHSEWLQLKRAKDGLFV